MTASKRDDELHLGMAMPLPFRCHAPLAVQASKPLQT